MPAIDEMEKLAEPYVEALLSGVAYDSNTPVYQAPLDGFVGSWEEDEDYEQDG